MFNQLINWSASSTTSQSVGVDNPTSLFSEDADIIRQGPPPVCFPAKGPLQIPLPPQSF